MKHLSYGAGGSVAYSLDQLDDVWVKGMCTRKDGSIILPEFGSNEVFGARVILVKVEVVYVLPETEAEIAGLLNLEGRIDLGMTWFWGENRYRSPATWYLYKVEKKHFFPHFFHPKD